MDNVSQIKLWQNYAVELLEKVKTMTKADDIEKMTKLAMVCHDKSREIQAEIKKNSLIWFCQLKLINDRKFVYQDYADFCVRNGLQVFSEVEVTDFLQNVGIK